MPEPRPRNFRRQITPKLRQIGEWRQWLTGRWTPPSRRLYRDPDGEWRYHQERRATIPAEEYPENNPEELRYLILYCRAIAAQAQEIVTMAEHRLGEIEQAQKAREEEAS